MPDEPLLKDVESELNDDPGPWYFIKNILIVFFCSLALGIGLAVNGVVGAPLFGFSAFLFLLWIDPNKP